MIDAKNTVPFFRYAFQPRNPNLPVPVIAHIVSFTDFQTAARCSLLDKKWNMITTCRTFWNTVWKNTRLTEYLNGHYYSSAGYSYRVVSERFSKAYQFQAAIAACVKCNEINSPYAAMGLREICKSLCKIKNYPLALECQALAKHYYADCGHEAMGHILNSQVNDEDFCYQYEELILSASTLLEENKEYGLKALIAIAKKLADMQKYEEAFTCASIGIDHNLEKDPHHPYLQMGMHMLTLNEHKKAKDYADQMPYPPIDLYADIAVKQIINEDVMNDIFIYIESDIEAVIRTCEKVIFELIDQNDLYSAMGCTKLRLQLPEGIFKFKVALSNKLKAIGIDPKPFFKINNT